MNYSVTFGSSMKQDGFGFTRSGEVKIEGDSVTYTGKKLWNKWLRVLVFLVLTVPLTAATESPFGAVIGLVVVMLFCASGSTLTLAKSGISDVERDGKMIKFKAPDPKSGKIRKSLFKVDTETNAAAIERELLNK